MGGQSSTEASSGNQNPSGRWFDYLQSVKSSSPSEIIPYYKSQITYLEKLFRQIDNKNTKSLELSQLVLIDFISQHSLSNRILQLFQQELSKIKTKKISFEIFLHLLTPFHINTTKQQKCKFLFRLYDWDKDFKINMNDLCLTFDMMFRQKIVSQKIMNQEKIKNMAGEALARYGQRGQIKLQQFIQMIEEDQIKQFLTWKFMKQ